MQFSTGRHLVAVAAICAVVAAPVRAAAETVLVFAAASLKNALDQVTPRFEQEAGHQITVSYAASSVLARQIQLGAPADMFISANTAWMDLLEENGQIVDATRVDLLGNSLVLIAGANSKVLDGEDITADFDLDAYLGDGYLAMALVDAVPAGIYGKAALESLGQWNALQDRVAQADNVRAALALVATGAAPLGIVYLSDAMADPRVTVVGRFPADSHQPIVYPAALTAWGKPSARQFLTYLQDDAVTDAFLEQGFTLPGG